LSRIDSHLLKAHFVIFIHRPSRLFNALSYVSRNEHGKKITIVHCKDVDCTDEEHDFSFSDLKKLLPSLAKAGVFPHFEIDVKYKNAAFSPAVVSEVARELHVPTNRIFIGSIHHSHAFDYHELEGVRIISG
jgi:hypothetical protein